MKKIQTLNIGSSAISLAEYEIGGKGKVKLLHYGVAQLAAPLDSGNASAILSPAILEIVRTKGIHPGEIAVAISGQMVFPKFAAIPLAGGQEKFDQMVRYEIEQNIPFPIDDMVCDHQVLGDTDSGDKSVMIVASKLDQVEPITSTLSAIGFSPMIVSAAHLSVTNVLHNNTSGSDDCYVVLDIGAKTTSLIIAEGEKLYLRSVPVAGNTITKEISQILGCSQEEAEQLKLERGYVAAGGVEEDEDPTADAISKAARSVLTRLNAEVSRSINFYRGQQGGGTPTKLYITGGTAMMPQIDVFFSESLGIEVEYLNPFERISTGRSVDAGELERDYVCLAATAGLALQMSQGSRYVVNLLPPSIIEERKEKARVPFVIASAAIFVAAAVCCYLGVSSKTEAIETERDEISAVNDSYTQFSSKAKSALNKQKAEIERANQLRDLMMKRAEAVSRTNGIRDAIGSDFWVESYIDGNATIRAWSDKAKALVERDGGKHGRTAPDILLKRMAEAQQIDEKSLSMVKKIDLGPEDKGAIEFVLKQDFTKMQKKEK